MKTKTLKRLFNWYGNSSDYLEFDKVENKRASRPDLHAFLLLNELVPGTEDIICGADHDEIFIGTDLDELAEVVTKGQILELVRCGVLLSGHGCLKMIV